MNARLQVKRGAYEALWNRTAKDRLNHAKTRLQRDGFAIMCLAMAIGYVVQMFNYYGGYV
jgi:hypothetical protein